VAVCVSVCLSVCWSRSWALREHGPPRRAVKDATLLLLDDWFGKPVKITEPWGKAPAGNRRPTFQKGIVFGVSTELSEYDIQKAQIDRWVMKSINGQLTKTKSVVLSYPEALQEFVCIGFLRYRVKPYICYRHIVKPGITRNA